MKHKQKTKQNETKTKHPTFVWEDDEVELLLKTTATILRFVFEGNSLPNKKKWADSGFVNETANAREAIFIAWASHFWSPWKQWQKRSGDHVHTQKRSGSETSVSEKFTFGSVFEKLRFGALAFSKSSGYVRIRVTVSMYPGSKSSVFEKTRVRVHVALVSNLSCHTIRSDAPCSGDLPAKADKLEVRGNVVLHTSTERNCTTKSWLPNHFGAFEFNSSVG